MVRTTERASHREMQAVIQPSLRRVMLLGSVAIAACFEPGSASAGPLNATRPNNGNQPVGRGLLKERASSNSFVAGHLYVAATAPSEGPTSIARYSLKNGRPADRPDLTYPNLSFAQFGVRPNNALFSVGYDQSTHDYVIYQFLPDSSKLSRVLQLPLSVNFTEYSGMTVDALGNMYVQYDFSSSSDFARAQTQIKFTSSSSPCATPFSFGILVYPPKARGEEPCLQSFPIFEGLPPAFVGLTTDVSGNLYVPLQQEVDVYSDPTTAPTVIRLLYGTTFKNATSVAVDDAGLLYVLNSTSDSYVAVYAKGANGKAPPLGKLYFTKAQQWFGNVAVDDKCIYIGGSAEVLVYLKNLRGRQTPLA